MQTWIYCSSHQAPHQLNENGSCWCGVSQMEMKEDGAYEHPLDYIGKDETYAAIECRRKNYKLYIVRNDQNKDTTEQE